jgi:hypothetical protein
VDHVEDFSLAALLFHRYLALADGIAAFAGMLALATSSSGREHQVEF